MRHNSIPQAEQLRPVEKLAKFGGAVLDFLNVYVQTATGFYSRQPTKRQQSLLGIEQLESHANDPIQHD